MIQSNTHVFLNNTLDLNTSGRVSNLPIAPDGREDFIASSRGDRSTRDMGRLALIFEDQGCHRAALEQYSNAAELFATSLGPHDFMTLFCRNKEASLLCSFGQYKKAEELSKSVVEAYTQTLGGMALHTLLSCCTLAQCLEKQAEHGAAYALLQDALDSMGSFYFTAAARAQLLKILAMTLLDLRIVDLAVFVAEECLRMSISLYGRGHPFTLNIMLELATAVY